MSEPEKPPTRLPPPPRTVRGGAGCGLWFIRLFILPHMIVGVVMIGLLALTVLVAAFGTNLPAIVTRAHTSRGSKGGTNYHLDYQYRAGDRVYTNSESVGASTYATATPAGELEGRAPTVRVRFLGLGPLHYHLLAQDQSPWLSAGQLLLFALFWNGILSAFVYIAWVLPLRNRRLVQHGQATQGTILSTRERRGKSVTYYASFRFTDPASGRQFTREMTLPGPEQYRAAPKGRVVTVLYDPRKPQRALAYELSGYRVTGAETEEHL